MADVIIGSARHDEFGKIAGKAGDQLQSGSGNDFKGEVSMQPYYVHKYGWDGLRFKKIEHRHKMAERTVKGCNNVHLGYSQPGRPGVVEKGVETTVDTNCDCGTFMRECFKEATGVDPGNFNTENEKKVLLATGLVEEFTVKESELMTGDILVSKKKGHTAAVVLGKSPDAPQAKYYPKYKGKSTSIVTALASIGEKDTSKAHRKKIAEANGIKNYIGLASQNLQMVNLLKNGKLIKA